MGQNSNDQNRQTNQQQVTANATAQSAANEQARVQDAPPPAAPVVPPAPPTSEATRIAVLEAQIADLKAAKDKTLGLPVVVNPLAGDILGLDGALNARDETAPVPLHTTHKTPLFNAQRPTGKG